jgi:branched-chain amino acid transport system ATP-binding protein
MVGMTPAQGRVPRLDVRDLSLRFGALDVLREITLRVPSFGITALIGQNGAGKTAFLNAVTGIYRPQSGQVLLDGEDITGLPADSIAAKGISRSFQHLELFERLTVMENLLVFRNRCFTASPLSTFWFVGRAAREEAAERAAAEAVIDFFELWLHRDIVVGSLPYGVQKITGFARAMAMEPRLLLLDEPGSGLTRGEKENLARFILRLRSDWKVPILWIEHDMDLLMDLADLVYVLELGRCIAAGTPNEVRANAEVRRAYLGES